MGPVLIQCVDDTGGIVEQVMKSWDERSPMRIVLIMNQAGKDLYVDQIRQAAQARKIQCMTAFVGNDVPRDVLKYIINGQAEAQLTANVARPDLLMDVSHSCSSMRDVMRAVAIESPLDMI